MKVLCLRYRSSANRDRTHEKTEKKQTEVKMLKRMREEKTDKATLRVFRRPSMEENEMKRNRRSARLVLLKGSEEILYLGCTKRDMNFLNSS